MTRDEAIHHIGVLSVTHRHLNLGAVLAALTATVRVPAVIDDCGTAVGDPDERSGFVLLECAEEDAKRLPIGTRVIVEVLS